MALDIVRVSQDLTVYKGDAEEFSVAVVDSLAADVDLTTGFTARMHLKASAADADEVLELTEADGLTLGDGSITIAMTAAQTAALTLKGYVYDIEVIETATDDVRTVARGRVLVTDDVTDPPTP